MTYYLFKLDGIYFLVVGEDDFYKELIYCYCEVPTNLQYFKEIVGASNLLIMLILPKYSYFKPDLDTLNISPDAYSYESLKKNNTDIVSLNY